MRWNAAQRLVICVLVCLTSGCTPNLWLWAQAPVAHLDRAGIAFSADGFGSKPALVFQYYGSRGIFPSPVLVIPLDVNGKPVAPFAYTGRARSVGEFWKSISAAQRRSIRRASHLVSGNGAGYSPLQSEVRGREGLEVHSTQCDNDSNDLSALVAFAYRPGSPRPLAIPVIVPGTAADSLANLPADATIVIVPQFVAEDDPGEPGRVVTAILLTPIALAADVVLIGTSPVWLPVLIWECRPEPPPKGTKIPTSSTRPTTSDR
jgi:hypothetical protein